MFVVALFKRAFSNTSTAHAGQGRDDGLSGSLIHDRTVRTEQGLLVSAHIRAALSAWVIL
ncbi:hypothetical protein IRT38_00230 (plasmid) [Acinetobacter sp. SK-43]|uniref:hypothetical protein n=1 Tax=Acinetobacter sp. SK-43 TaxID=2785295 RepID=UPI00188B3D00|nr:hypothetical protein [Acinetobacter sp. SK-43]MBF4453840.1 hypothetical protein [Acinetobacter sp. SK-43]